MGTSGGRVGVAWANAKWSKAGALGGDRHADRDDQRAAALQRRTAGVGRAFPFSSSSPPSTHHRRSALDGAQDVDVGAAAALTPSACLISRPWASCCRAGRPQPYDPAVDAVAHCVACSSTWRSPAVSASPALTRMMTQPAVTTADTGVTRGNGWPFRSTVQAPRSEPAPGVKYQSDRCWGTHKAAAYQDEHHRMRLTGHVEDLNLAMGAYLLGWLVSKRAVDGPPRVDNQQVL